MGNRAVIAFSDNAEETGIYLHWNGGPESVLAFLQAADDIGGRTPQLDRAYAMAALIRAITLFMHDRDGELLSVGVGRLGGLDCDNFDNGLYLVGGDWSIVARKYARAGHNKMAVNDLDERERATYDAIRRLIVERHKLLCTTDIEAAA